MNLLGMNMMMKTLNNKLKRFHTFSLSVYFHLSGFLSVASLTVAPRTKVAGALKNHFS